MPLLGRNVIGDDILALWNHIDRVGPVKRDILLQRFYPGNAEDHEQSSSLKTLKDAIDFLVEADQIEQTPDGYVLRDECLEATSPRVSLIKELRDQSGEDAAYMGALEVLTEEDRRYFDTGNEFEDLLSKRWSSVNWTENKIGYWARTMSMIGVIAPINSNSDENYTYLLSLSQNLLVEILKDRFSPNEPIKIESVMNALEDEYLPVYATANKNRMAEYFERALKQAESNESIALGQASDFGATMDINGRSYNELTLRVSSN